MLHISRGLKNTTEKAKRLKGVGGIQNVQTRSGIGVQTIQGPSAR